MSSKCDAEGLEQELYIGQSVGLQIHQAPVQIGDSNYDWLMAYLAV